MSSFCAPSAINPKISFGSATPRRVKRPSDSSRPAQESRSDELSGDEDFAAERVAQFFDPGDLVDRGPDHCEIEPIGRADIAIEHLPDMQRQIDADGRQPRRRALRIARLQGLHRLDRRVERAVAGFRLIGLLERERREHRVADEFQDLAAARPQRRGQCLEHVIEHFDDGGTGRCVADRGEAADIGVPEHGVQAVRGAALDSPVVDTAARVVA